MPLIGFMNSLSPEVAPHFIPAFRQGLKEQGFVEGQNVAVDYRWAYGHYDRLPEFAADLVRRQVAVIAATGGQSSPGSQWQLLNRFQSCSPRAATPLGKDW